MGRKPVFIEQFTSTFALDLEGFTSASLMRAFHYKVKRFVHSDVLEAVSHQARCLNPLWVFFAPTFSLPV